MRKGATLGLLLSLSLLGTSCENPTYTGPDGTVFELRGGILVSQNIAPGAIAQAGAHESGKSYYALQRELGISCDALFSYSNRWDKICLSFIERIERNTELRSALILAKKQNVLVYLNDNFSTLIGSVYIDVRATDQEIIDFLLLGTQ